MIIYPVVTERLIPPIASVFLTYADRALVTAYQFVQGEKPLRNLAWFAKQFGDRKVILDSGLFTLLKDHHVSRGGEALPQAYYDRYFEKYKRIIGTVPDHWCCIELDAQVLPGISVEAYRKWFEAEGLVDRTLFVWHLKEGVKAFGEYLRKYKRVALSHREIKSSGFGTCAVHGLLRSRRQDWAGHHIHLLGTGHKEFASVYPDNFTGDSATWSRISHYGWTPGGLVTARVEGKKIVAPESVLDRVRNKIPEAIENYRRHPEYSHRKGVRTAYLWQLACGLIVFQDHQKRLRDRNAAADLSATDPLIAKVPSWPKAKPPSSSKPSRRPRRIMAPS